MKKVSSSEQSRVKKAETAAGNSELTGSVELDFEKKLILFILFSSRFQSARSGIK